MALTLGDSWNPWHPSVRRGLWSPDGGEHQEVLVVRLELADTLDLRSHPAMLDLLAVERKGEETYCIYEMVEGIGVQQLVDDRVLGLRAAAELVCEVARVVSEVPHVGPAPEDVLLLEDGSVRVANFGSTLAESLCPIPGEGTTESDTVYRLGGLLAYVLGGAIPRASSEAGHGSEVRRAQIRAMSRPGAVFSERYGDWLRGMLAWEPAERPPLSRVIEGLEELGRNTPGPTLEETVVSHHQTWTIALLCSDPDETTLPVDWEVPRFDVVEPHRTAEMSTTGRRTLADDRILGSLDLEDEPTVDSELGKAPDYTPPSIIERGSIPVSVGPPAEAVVHRPSLPPGFLGEDTEARLLEPEAPTEVARPSQSTSPYWLIPLAVALAVAAGALFVYLVV